MNRIWSSIAIWAAGVSLIVGASLSALEWALGLLGIHPDWLQGNGEE